MLNATRGERTRRLAAELAAGASLWRPSVFHDDPAWVTARPVLAGHLLALDEHALQALENDPAALQALLQPLAPELATLGDSADACLDPLPPPAPLAIPESRGRDIPGRKWQQTLHFAAACGTPQGPLLDWCCGKAHLGRLLAQVYGTAVTGIERDAALCIAGNALAAREQLPVRIHRGDVLQDRIACTAETHAVALHACGDLHLALLRAAATARIAALDLAPCCYHLVQEKNWQPLSAALHDSPLATLALTAADLRLAVQETATAGARVVRQSRQLAAWRLGYDALQRKLRGIDTALPATPRSPRLLAGGFAAFCADLAGEHGLTLPATTDWTYWEEQGRQRQERTRRLQLPRHAARRPLEILLAADRALWLAEQGYEVRLRAFCARRLTPRNLLLQARRQDPSGAPLPGQVLPVA